MILATREQKYIDKFIALVEQTAKRKGVSFHEREHYQQMFQNIYGKKIVIGMGAGSISAWMRNLPKLI